MRFYTSHVNAWETEEWEKEVDLSKAEGFSFGLIKEEG